MMRISLVYWDCDGCDNVFSHVGGWWQIITNLLSQGLGFMLWSSKWKVCLLLYFYSPCNYLEKVVYKFIYFSISHVHLDEQVWKGGRAIVFFGRCWLYSLPFTLQQGNTHISLSLCLCLSFYTHMLIYCCISTCIKYVFISFPIFCQLVQKSFGRIIYNDFLRNARCVYLFLNRSFMF